ncbi:MAG: hypothetical protein GY703_00145 [Gammaproteobacteria bacterium]|nr:hypothetical protein [Gammaproteobacteria bacterium]
MVTPNIPSIETRRTVVLYEQRNPAMLLDSQPFTTFTMSIFRRLREYSGRTGLTEPSKFAGQEALIADISANQLTGIAHHERGHHLAGSGQLAALFSS